MRRFARVAWLALLLAALGGCRTSAGTSPAPTVTALPVAAVSPRQGVHRLMDTFDRAVLIRAMTSARGYLTPALAAQTPPMRLAAALGLRNIPRAAHYTVTHLGPQRATVEVQYQVSPTAARDRLTLVQKRGLWRIAVIQTGK